MTVTRWYISGLVKYIQLRQTTDFLPQDELKRQAYLTLTAAIIDAREHRTDVIVWCQTGRWEWAIAANPLAVSAAIDGPVECPIEVAVAADPYLPVSAYIDGPVQCQITVTDDTNTVRRVTQLGESTVTPVPSPVPQKRIVP